MPEFIKTAEVIGNVAQRAYKAGKFVVERLSGGGGWSDIPHPEPGPARPPVRASIQYFNSGEAAQDELPPAA